MKTALEAQRQRSATASRPGPAAQTLPHLSFILRPRAAAEQVARNGAWNLEEGRVAYLQGVFDRR
jgi:hypothetical protein